MNDEDALAIAIDDYSRVLSRLATLLRLWRATPESKVAYESYKTEYLYSEQLRANLEIAWFDRKLNLGERARGMTHGP